VGFSTSEWVCGAFVNLKMEQSYPKIKNDAVDRQAGRFEKA